ncbi:MAG: hypothetical protein ACXVB1_16710 [Pseudobdellovibrionaceae bacterium]
MKNLVALGLFLSLTFLTTVKAGAQVIYFGNLEVNQGALTSVDGNLPRAGSNAVLRVFSRELAARVYDESMAYQGGYGAYGTNPHLFVRFIDGENFQERSLAGASVNLRGPSFGWPSDHEDVSLQIPRYADRIEAYLVFERAIPTDCHLAYDMMECSKLTPWEPAYISNYGKNFKIKVH